MQITVFCPPKPRVGALGRVWISFERVKLLRTNHHMTLLFCIQEHMCNKRARTYGWLWILCNSVNSVIVRKYVYLCDFKTKSLWNYPYCYAVSFGFSTSSIRDFRVARFKARLSAKSLISFDMKIPFYFHANRTHYHKKVFALSLVLKVKDFKTRK